VWTTDFKGEFRTGNRVLCYPLTVCDAHTRYQLACHGLLSTETRGPRRVFERLFAEFGLPDAIRTDNGSPFASTAVAGLSQLNIWWIKLGIQHQRITPASPQENGRHERMHRTLKAETTRPPGRNLMAQRKLFSEWKDEYNHERPHEALGQVVPGSMYTPSLRVLPRRTPGPEYSGHLEVRRVGSNGCIKWKCRRLFVSETLAGEDVALEPVEDEIWSLLFYDVLLGRFHERDWQLKG
jgi:transposase InsO family protein